MPLIEDFVPVEPSQEKSDGGFSIEDAVPGEFAAGGLVVPGALRTATSNVIRGAVQSVTAPVSYLGALTGIEFLGDTAKKVDEFTNDLTPVNPDLADSWLATYIPQGLGQVGAMMVPGAAFFKVARGLEVAGNVANAAGKVAEGAQLLAKAQKVEQAGKVAIFGIMGGMEGNDAYQMAIEQGDDQATAAAKSLGYATVAAAIENKWGTGMLIRRMEGLLGKEVAAKELVKHGLTQSVAKDVMMGALEEGSQRFAENLIVTGQPSLEGVGTEGGVGGIVQGLVGLPMHIAMRSMTPEQKIAVKQAEGLTKAGAPATAQVVLEDILSSPLTEQEVSILEPGEQKTEIATEQTQTATPSPILATPEVIASLEQGDAPLTAAVVQEQAVNQSPIDISTEDVTNKSDGLPATQESSGETTIVAEKPLPKPDSLEQDLSDLSTAIQDIRQRMVERSQKISGELPTNPETMIEAPNSNPDLQAAPIQSAPVASQFAKDTRVRSDRYGEGKVLRSIGNRIQVQFDDGSKFAVSKGELTPIQAKPVENQAQSTPSLSWKDAATRTTATDSLARVDALDAQKQIKNLQRQEARINKKEDLTDKDRENLQDIQQEIQSHRQTLQTYEDYQQRQPEKDVIESALDKAIEATKFKPGQLMEGVTGAPVWMTKSLINGALRIIRVAYRGGKALAAAIDEGIAWVRSQQPQGFDEAEARKWLHDTTVNNQDKVLGESKVSAEPKAPVATGERKTGEAGKNLLNTEWAERNPKLARAIKEQTYTSTTNKERNDIAVALVDFHGNDLESAYDQATRPASMSGVTEGIQQSMLAYIVTKAEKANQPLLAMKALAYMTQQRSKMGQDLQGTQAAEQLFIEKGSPAAWNLRAQSDFEQDQKPVIEPILKASDVQEKIQDSKKEAVKNIVGDIEKLASKFFPKAMKEMGVTMQSVMEQHADSQEATRRALFDLISSNPQFDGLSQADKIRLANELQTLWEKARNKELERIFKKEAQAGGGNVTGSKIALNSLPRLIKLINSGILTDESVYNAIAPEFNLPHFDEALAAEISKKALDMQRTPEGLPRNQKYIDLLNTIALKRKLTNWEIAKAYWYASILSGTGTQVTNGVAAAVNVQLQNLLLAASNPMQAGKIFLGALKGYGVGFLEAPAIMGRGDLSNRITSEIQSQSGTLELAAKETGWKKALSNFKYITRLMAFVDTMNAMSAMEARAYFLASQSALGKFRDGEITQSQIDDEIFKILQVRPQDIAKYKAVAEAEAAQGLISSKDIARRTQNLIQRARPSEIMEEALNYGRVATFNNKPVGFGGALADSVNTLRYKFPPLTIIFPFVQTPANVLNEMLNYTPVGLWRMLKQNPEFRLAAKSKLGLDLKAQELSPADYQILRAKAVFGFMTFVGTALLAAHFDDDKDPPFDISGGWYDIDSDKQKQLIAQGKRKWSIKIGNTWIDYRQTPLAIMLATIGNYRDTKKYETEKQKGANLSSMTYHLMHGAFVVKDMSFLSSFSDLMNMFNPQNTAPLEKRMASFMGRTAGGISPNLFKEIDTWFDPSTQKPESFLENLQSQIPVARGRLGKPQINVLGQELKESKTAADRFWNTELVDDPVWKQLSRLADMGVFVPNPSATAKVLKDGKRVRMTDEQVYEYRKKTGELYQQKLQRDLPRISQMDAEAAKKYFDKEFPVLRERARAMVR